MLSLTLFKTSFNKHGCKAIAYLFILLFTYAAVSKLLDFETFTIQLAQSPMFSAYAEIVSWLVPGTELLISIILMLPKFRRIGLYAFFFLMVLFTAYIIIILNYADFVPCSCGGVLEALSWNQHLLFNAVFIILAVLAIGTYSIRTTKLLIQLSLLTFVAIGMVAVLFIVSEKEIHRNNAFQRRYPHHPANKDGQLDVGYNSYYFAGVTSDSVYLGNHTASLLLTSIDNKLKDTVWHKIQIQSKVKSLGPSRFIVNDNHIFLIDGSTPTLLKTDIFTYSFLACSVNNKSFMNAESMGGNTFAIRSFDSKNLENVLGRLVVGDPSTTTTFPGLIKKQGEFFFDSDGILLYNNQLQKIIYVYYYRNKFLVSNKDFSIDYNGSTIDTISTAQLNVHTIKSRNEQKLGNNPLFVNHLAATYGKYLFIQSDRLGRYEPKKVLKHASIIDVYNLENHSYAFSFYLYHHNLKKLMDFVVSGHKLYALVDNYLISYNLKKENFKYKK